MMKEEEEEEESFGSSSMSSGLQRFVRFADDEFGIHYISKLLALWK